MRTTDFCDRVLDAAARPLTPAVAAAAQRSLFNVLGTVVGAAWSPAADAILGAARELSGRGRVRVLGRPDILDEHWAALRRLGPSAYHRYSFTGVAAPWATGHPAVTIDQEEGEECR